MRTAIVIDYQNVHLTGAGLFEPHRPLHENLIDPGRYARELIRVRNASQRPGFDHASVELIHVFRGLPAAEHDPDGYRRNQAQRNAWIKDPLVRVVHRPLKYHYRQVGGIREVIGKREKGIDVLCALATVRLAVEYDLVVLASQDTDLEPALDEARALGRAKIETASWYQEGQWSRQIRAAQNVWNTRLDQTSFYRSTDPRTY